MGYGNGGLYILLLVVFSDGLYLCIDHPSCVTVACKHSALDHGWADFSTRALSWIWACYCLSSFILKSKPMAIIQYLAVSFLHF
jgi:hypothetical protein